jgi:predicted phosphodiesterase
MPAKPLNVASKTARDYCKKFPDSGTRTLARMLMRDHSKLYHDYEHARSSIRFHRGENGKQGNRTKASAVVPTMKHERFEMPASDAKPIRAATLNLQGNGLIAGDWHVPYHDKAACEIAVNHAIEKGHTDWLLINGDFLDCYQLSRWERDPRRRGFSGELEIAKAVLKDLAKVFKRLIYKEGNHETRYERYLKIKAAELLGVKEFRLRRLLKLKTLGYEYVSSNRVIQIGKLNVLHGHEYAFAISNPVNPARGLFLRAKASAICSHFHQTSQHTEADIRRSPTSCWSIGALCDLSPEYAPLNKWNHGFALASVSGEEYQVENCRIIHGKVM